MSAQITPDSDREIAAGIRRLAGGRRIAFVSGNFNTVHPGHLRLLRFAAECGEFLCVGVSDDSVEGVLLPQDLRLDGVRSIGLVDYAFILCGPPERLIGLLQPAMVVKGKEHENRENPELAVVESYGGKLLFSSGEMRFSSIDLLKREVFEAHITSIVRPMDFSERHGFDMASLRSVVKKFAGFRVTVVGDLIVDEYIACDPLGMSQEDPTIVVTPIQSERFIGGAAIVASHARRLGADVRYFTVAGTDATADFACAKLNEYGVTAQLLADPTRPTTLKQRYRASGKTLLRVSHLRQHEISQDLVEALCDAVVDALAQSDLLVFSDFNYGCLPQAVIEEISSAGSRRKLCMVADSQSSSQFGDISRFKGMMLLTPTEREARFAMRDFASGLVVLAERLREKSGAKNIIMTLGAEGVIGHAASANDEEWLTDRLPAFNTAPQDPAGAGDSLLSCAAMGLAVGADFWQSMYLGSIAAACQVSRVGNMPLSLAEIAQELKD